MQIRNPITLNDWRIRSYFIAILVFQLGLLVIQLLGSTNSHILVLQAILGFAFFSFIPGIIVLRIMRVHYLSTIETLLYAVGLSIAILMFTGLLMSVLYPLVGISRPLSSGSILMTINVTTSILLLLSLVRDKEPVESGYIDTEMVLSRPALLLYLVPLLTIIGTYFVNQYHSNGILMLVIAFIAVIPILVGFDRVIPEALYPLAILSISVSLLLHTSLISLYLWGYDIHYETFLANLVMDNAFWDSTSPGNVNAMLSVVLMAPIYSYITGLDLTWVFKLVYPLTFALVPLGLYHVFRRQVEAKSAFLACFFFVSFIIFYAEMASLARQEIAELFLVLLIMLMVARNIPRTTNFTLFVVFGASLAISHYGTSYIYLLALIAVWLYMTLSSIAATRGDTMLNRSRTAVGERSSGGGSLSRKDDGRTITLAHVLFFTGFTLGWYMLVAGGTSFDTIVSIIDHIGNTIFVDLLNPEATEGLDLLISTPQSPLHTVAKGLHLITLALIVVGFIAICFRRTNTNFSREYVAFSFIALLFGVAGVLVPNFSSTLNTSRLYQIVLIFLAPLCVIGGISILAAPGTYISKLRSGWLTGRTPLVLISVLFSLLFLFSTGWIYECANDQPSSIALSQDSIKKYGGDTPKNVFYGTFIPEHDVFGARWLGEYMRDGSIVYADRTRKDNVLTSYGNLARNPPFLPKTDFKPVWGAYTYLGTYNVVERSASGPEEYYDHWSIEEIYPAIYRNNKVYSNGQSGIYRNE
ncbi:DUF2206 domain-containing protein [Methanoculleus chikugoensis]|uniref:DUF2206 domain-containing protein n=1 Tax=Methanoculleus chikugoensis TaxID=118126 RepID=A0ABM7H677_9EURY|nr:DUF2206 domain-containing protein [Methanoculleus chikugoensis]BBL68215.1 hypothetical protein MchiMG62_13960 [Methanoculleus chikugoensis]